MKRNKSVRYRVNEDSLCESTRMTRKCDEESEYSKRKKGLGNFILDFFEQIVCFSGMKNHKEGIML